MPEYFGVAPFLKPSLLHHAADRLAHAPDVGVIASLVRCSATTYGGDDPAAAEKEVQVLQRLISDIEDFSEMTTDVSFHEQTTLHRSCLSPVVERPDRRIPFLGRVAVFLRRPRFRGHLARAVGALAHEWWIAQLANLREWMTPGSRLLNTWTGTDPLPHASSVAIYIHYSPCNRVSEMVLRQVKEYRSHGFTVIFVSMCRSLDMCDLERLRGITGLVLLRRNFALDFGAWHDVIPLLRGIAPDLCELLLVNDSVCGPLTSMFRIFKRFRAHGDGLFGLTENLAPRPHLQSYFLLARGKSAVADLMCFVGKTPPLFLQANRHPPRRGASVELDARARSFGGLAARLRSR